MSRDRIALPPPKVQLPPDVPVCELHHPDGWLRG
jgi:hypothetical protein